MSMTDVATAIAGLEKNANPEWKQEFLNSVRAVASTKGELTSHDVWRHLESRTSVTTRDNRAAGALMLRAVKEGILSQTDRAIRTTDPQRVKRNRALVRVWKSELYVPAVQ